MREQNEMNGQFVFETERLALYTIKDDDLNDLYALRKDPETMRYYPKTLTLEETRQWLIDLQQEQQQHGFSRWACHLKDDGTFVGICGLKLQKEIAGRDEIEVGYTFNRQFWNQGLATEAAKATMDYARRVFGFKRLISLIRPENIPSRRVAEKNGLLPETEILHHGFVHIVYVHEL